MQFLNWLYEQRAKVQQELEVTEDTCLEEIHWARCETIMSFIDKAILKYYDINKLESKAQESKAKSKAKIENKSLDQDEHLDINY